MRRVWIGLLFVANAARAIVPPTPVPAAPPSPPMSVFQEREAGSVEHLQSGLRCPPSVNGYKRTRLIVFDKFGLDVSCNYKTATADITLYLTRRASGDLDSSIAEAKGEDFGDMISIAKPFARG